MSIVSKLAARHLRQLDLLAQLHEDAVSLAEHLYQLPEQEATARSRELTNLLDARDALEAEVLEWVLAAGLSQVLLGHLQASLSLELARLGYYLPGPQVAGVPFEQLFDQVASVAFATDTPGRWGASRVTGEAYRRLLQHLLATTGTQLQD